MDGRVNHHAPYHARTFSAVVPDWTPIGPLSSLHRLERVDWLSEAERREQREQQTLAALSQRDQQLSQMGAMLEEARTTSKPREVLREGYQREVSGTAENRLKNL